MASEGADSLHVTFGHYRAPLIIAALGAALSILAFLAALSSEIDEQRQAFVRFAEIQAQILVDQLQYANQQLDQLSAYAEALKGMDRTRFEVFARQLLSEDGLAYAGWTDASGDAFGMWQGTEQAIEPRNPIPAATAPAARSGHRPRVALTRIADPGSGNLAQLVAVMTVKPGAAYGSVIGRIDVAGVVAATLTRNGLLPTVVHILDDRGIRVFSSDQTDARDLHADPGIARNARYFVERNVDLFQRPWTLIVFPPTAYLIRQTGIYPWLVLAFSLAMTVLIGLIAFQQARQTLTVRERVADQTFAIRQMAEAAVRTECRLQAIFDTSVDGLITIDGNGIVENYNPACERLFGYTAKEVVGRNIRMLMPEPVRSSHDGYLKKYLETSEARIIGVGREVRAQRKDGTTFPMELAVAEMRDGDQLRFSGVIRDITERQELLEGLRASNEELERFAYVASHDLKTPLRAIDNLSQWIEEDLSEQLDGETGEHMRLLRGRVRRMDRLLDDLLDYSRVGRKECEGTYSVASASEIVDEVLLLLAPPAGFRIVSGTALSQTRVNRIPLQQVLFNLIGNATKHHDRAEGTVTVDVTVGAQMYEFRVADDGPGIDAAHHRRIFDMFQTLQPRDAVEGSGEGLVAHISFDQYFGGLVRRKVGIIGGRDHWRHFGSGRAVEVGRATGGERKQRQR